MKKYHFLTLSIAEGVPGSKSFEVNCANLSNTIKLDGIFSFSLTKEQIFDLEGNPLWDIGKITRLEDQPKPSTSTLLRNRVFEPIGKAELLKNREISQYRLKEFLEANKTDYTIFESDKSMPFAIVKVRHLVSIEEDQGDKKLRKQRLIVDFDDDHRLEKILNKDYRWIHYWRQIPDDGLWEKQEHMRNLLNQPGKNLYLILRRFAFKEQNRKRWISGMHWL